MATDKTYAFATVFGDFTLDLSALLEARLDTPERRAALKARLHDLNLAKEDKGLLWSLVDKGVTVADRVLRVGQLALEVLVSVAERFPNALCGLVVGLAAQALLGAVPLLGWILAPLLGGLTVAILTLGGLALDVKRAVQLEVRRVFVPCCPAP